MKIRERLKKIREGLKIVVQHSVYDAARHNGLAIEYPEGMPANYTGHLDTDDPPRFIAVNPELARLDQVRVIAREIARYGQLRQLNSPVIDRSWKWTLLANAPVRTREKICAIDIEVRAQWLLILFTSHDDFRALFKNHLTRFLFAGFAQHAIAEL